MVYTYRCYNKLCANGNGGKPYEHQIPGSAEAEPAEVVSCPRCGSPHARRVYAAPTVLYRGSGWTRAGRERR